MHQFWRQQDVCAENGIAIVVADQGFNIPVTGNKYDGSLSRYTTDGSYNRVYNGSYDIGNSYNWFNIVFFFIIFFFKLN